MDHHALPVPRHTLWCFGTLRRTCPIGGGTSTLAVTNATFPYAKKPAKLGWKNACKKDPSLALGLNVVEGKVVYPGVAEAFGLALTDPNTAIN